MDKFKIPLILLILGIFLFYWGFNDCITKFGGLRAGTVGPCILPPGTDMIVAWIGIILMVIAGIIFVVNKFKK